jgi:hypothetical protein
MLLTETHLTLKDEQTENKGMEIIIIHKGKQNRIKVAIIIWNSEP